MAAAAQTAHRGRRARRAKGITFAAWRLLALAALAYAAMMLLGGTAQAAECPESGCAKPQRTDLVRTLATTTRGLTQGTKTLVGTTTDSVTATTQALAVQKPVSDAPAPLANTSAPTAPAVEPVADGAAGITQTPALPAVDSPTPDPAVVVTLPSLEETVMPAVTAGAELVDATTAALASATASIEVPALGQVTTSLAATVDGATDDLLSLTHTATRIADQDVSQVTRVLDPLLPSLSGLGGGVDVTSAANRTAAAGAAPDGETAAAAWAPWTTATPMASARPLEATAGTQQATTAGPAVPPPDAPDLTVVQSAPDTVAVMTVPVSGAGATTSGSASGGPSAPGGPELSKCLVAGFRRTDVTVAGPVAVPARPLPGTPLDDPSFSPD